MGKQRNPFVHVNEIGGGAANEHVGSIGVPDEAGFAKLLDDLAGDGGRWIIQFHAGRIGPPVGQPSSNPDESARGG